MLEGHSTLRLRTSLFVSSPEKIETVQEIKIKGVDRYMKIA